MTTRLDHGIQKIKDMIKYIRRAFDDYYTRNYPNAILYLQRYGERLMALYRYYRSSLGKPFVQDHYIFFTLRKEVAYYYRFYNQVREPIQF